VHKRKTLDNLHCLFCDELETVHRLLFDCCVAKQLWSVIDQEYNVPIGDNYELVGTKWLCNKKFMVSNMLSSAIMWFIWDGS
jgi:hypothetical protein